MSALLDAVREALRDERAWLVGGAVRDRLLGHEAPPDLDLAVDGDVRIAAARVARAVSGSRFALSDAFGAWRVVADAGQVDLVPLQGGTPEADLAARDLTINAIAEPLEGGALVDPHDGAADLAARVLRMVGPAAFATDPLRVVRVARFAAQLGFEVDPATAEAARAAAGGLTGVAGERVWAELRRMVAGPGAVAGWEVLADLGAEAVLLPELAAAHGVEQSRYHHKDVHGHVLEVLQVAIDLREDPVGVLGDPALDAPVRALLAEPLADELDRGAALRWAALLHDVAKPQTRTSHLGRVGFPGHDRAGAEIAREILTRLRTSERLRSHVATLTRHHLRVGFLVREAPLDRRAEYRELRDTEPAAADVVLLTVCDRLATRGRKADEAIERHLEVARGLLHAALGRWPAHRALAPLLRGDELAAELGIRHGPRLGELLAAVDEARYAGEVVTREEALALARQLGAAPPAP